MKPITIEHSDSIYFSTGDIVLLSLPEDDVVTAFKVDRVFLIRSSPVFEGMLALPLSGDVESYDNAPLVKLQDEPNHLTMFLQALYDSRCIPWQKHDPNTVRMVEGILLLATKYQVDHLRERVISLLERDWPSKLSDWDLNEAEIKVKKESVETVWEVSFPDPCEAIRLARKCDVPSILPAAFYYLSRIRGTSDCRVPAPLRGVMFDLNDDEVVPNTDFSLLSAQDLYALVVGRDVIHHLFKRYLNNAHLELTKIKDKHYKSDSKKCRESLAEIKEELSLEVFRDFEDPLTVMKRDVKGGDDNDCFFCRMEFTKLIKSQREILWDDLPSIFMLDTKQ